MGARREALRRFGALLAATAGTPYFAVLVAGLTCLTTLSMSVPTTTLLVLAAFLARGRWLRVALAAAAGSALGALLLVDAFQGLTLAKIAARWPEAAQANAWAGSAEWVRAHGALALGVICALPAPQTPALALCALSGVPAPQIALAVFAGKALKYSVVAFAVAEAPERLGFLRRRLVQALPRHLRRQ